MCSIENMSHSPYLFHKVVINHFFDYSVCFIRVTDYFIRVSQFFRGLQPSVATSMQKIYGAWGK